MCWNINNLLPEQGSGQVLFKKGRSVKALTAQPKPKSSIYPLTRAGQILRRYAKVYL